MSALGCSLETDVRTAAVTGRWSQELREHASECRHCRDVAFVASTLAGAPTASPHSINPGVLWMRARFARRQRAEAQVSRILTGAQIVAGALVAGTLVAIARQMEWWSGLSDATVPLSFVAAVGLLMLAGVVAASFVSRET